MNAVRKHPAFFAGLIALGLFIVGEGWCVFQRVHAARSAQVQLEQRRRELRSIAAVQPAPTADNAARILGDLTRISGVLAALRTSLKGKGPGATLQNTPAPSRRIDAYFDIAAFVEKMRVRALECGVGLKTDERFGFTEYANAGPEPELIRAVFRQRLLAERVLEVLFQAHPRELLALQRERAPATGERVSRNEAASRQTTAHDGDYFEIDPDVSARVRGLVDTMAFRLVFTGQTAALRTFVNQIAELELPLAVRTIEVEPVAMTATVGSLAAGKTPAVLPLVPQSLSRFTVTVEYIELTDVPLPVPVG